MGASRLRFQPIIARGFGGFAGGESTPFCLSSTSVPRERTRNRVKVHNNGGGSRTSVHDNLVESERENDNVVRSSLTPPSESGPQMNTQV